MFYHIIIEKLNASKKESNVNVFCYDLGKEFVIEKILKPYLIGKNFIVDGYSLNKSNVERFKLVSTEKRIDELVLLAQNEVPDGFVYVCRREDIVKNNRYVKDVTQSLIDEVSSCLIKIPEREISPKENVAKYVFIAHGHDNNNVEKIENLIRNIGLEPIVLFKEADAGQTIIEKIEKYTSEACYGIILYTKCDYGYEIGHENDIKPRARQNVVFEHGYLMAKLNRNHICALFDDECIEKPSDISGIVYQLLDDAGNWKYKLVKNMRNVGIDVDSNKIK